MTTITLEEARLIIKRWAESSALLLVATSEQPGEVIGRFSVVETTDDGVLFRSVGGDTQFSLDLSLYETTCSYSKQVTDTCFPWFLPPWHRFEYELDLCHSAKSPQTDRLSTMKVFIALVLPLLILGSAIAFAIVVPHRNNMPQRSVAE